MKAGFYSACRLNNCAYQQNTCTTGVAWSLCASEKSLSAITCILQDNAQSFFFLMVSLHVLRMLSNDKQHKWNSFCIFLSVAQHRCDAAHRAASVRLVPRPSCKFSPNVHQSSKHDGAFLTFICIYSTQLLAN